MWDLTRTSQQGEYPQQGEGLPSPCCELAYVESLCFTSSNDIPDISTIFCLVVVPRTMLIERLGKPSRSASSATSASLAAPSTGGAVRRTFRFPCSHSMLFLLLRGTTFTEMSMLFILLAHMSVGTPFIEPTGRGLSGVGFLEGHQWSRRGGGGVVGWWGPLWPPSSCSHN